MSRAIALLLVLLIAVGMAAESTVQIALKSSETVAPRSTIFVSLVLKTVQTDSVTRVRSEISFPEEILAFEKATLALGAEMVGAILTTEKQPAVSNSKGLDTVVITVTAKKPLRDGVLATLELRTSNAAKEGTAVTLRNESAAFGQNGQPIGPVESPEGKFTVSSLPPPIIPCFFYMH